MSANNSAHNRINSFTQGLRAKARRHGFTLIELLVVIAIISLLASMILPTLGRAKAKAQRIVCVNNQHQISLGFTMWADDNDSHYPWEISVLQGGSKGSCATWQHLIPLQEEIATPRILVCPSDDREAALDFSTNRITGLAWNGNYAVSYFVGLDARQSRPQMHLLGDRNINGLELQSCPPTSILGVVTWLLPTNQPTWSITIHRWAGNIARVDGSVVSLSQAGLRNQCYAAAADTHANCALKPEFTTG